MKVNIRDRRHTVATLISKARFCLEVAPVIQYFSTATASNEQLPSFGVGEKAIHGLPRGGGRDGRRVEGNSECDNTAKASSGLVVGCCLGRVVVEAAAGVGDRQAPSIEQLG